MKECKEFEIFNTQLAAYCGKGVRSDFFKQVLAPSWWEKSMEDEIIEYFEQIPDEEIENPPLFADEQDRVYITEKAMQIIRRIPSSFV